ncbi:MAG: hypothetical protein JNK90_17975 [Planctomycetaceae bacterium]|nr:hypothetical protein [Planctomycetaceae bacterium]
MTYQPQIETRKNTANFQSLWLVSLFCVWLVGCSSTKGNVATEQLLMSDAVDRTVSDFDFTPLAGNKVFLDTAFIVPNRNPQQLINTDYVISAMRQQMIAAGCQLVTTRDEADVIAEARLGALGTDGQMIIYGVPENSFLSRAASVLPNAPPMPSIPEIALAKKDHKSAAAKLAVFAYDRKTLEPVWQSGLIQSESTALDTWVLGVGPFRRGTVEDAANIAASRSRSKRPAADGQLTPDENALVSYDAEWVYSRNVSASKEEANPVMTAEAIGDKAKGEATTASATQEAPASVISATSGVPATTGAPAATLATPVATPAPTDSIPAEKPRVP